MIKYITPTFYLSYFLFFIGHLISIPMDKLNMSFLYPAYNKVMLWSSGVQGKGAGPWFQMTISEYEELYGPLDLDDWDEQ